MKKFSEKDKFRKPVSKCCKVTTRHSRQLGEICNKCGGRCELVEGEA